MNIFENKEEIELYTAQNIWGEASIDLYFRQKAQHNRRDIGLSGYSVCEDTHIQLNYAQIQTKVNKIAQELLFLGLNTGDIVALQLPNSVETQIIYLACWQQGIVVAPLPSLWREKDIKQALIRISPQAFIAPILHDGYNYTELMYQIALDISSIKSLFSLGGNPIDGCVALDDSFAHQPTHDVTLLKPNDYPRVDANSSCLVTFSKDSSGNNVPYYHTHNQLIAAANIYNSIAEPDQTNTIISPFPPTSMAICAITTVSWVISDCAMNCYDGLMATEFQDIATKSAIFCLPHTFDEPELVKALFEQGLDKLVFINKITDVNKPQNINSNVIDVTIFGEYIFIPQIRDKNHIHGQDHTYKYSLHDSTVDDYIQISQHENRESQYIWQISSSFLPTNIIKAQNKFNSDIPCEKKSNPTEKFYIGNMALNFRDLEQDILAFHGVEDAAILAIDDNLLGLKPVVAIVPKVGAVILHHEIVEFLKSKQHATYKIPQELYKTPSIPRDYRNNIIRYTSKKQLLDLVGPQHSTQADGLLSVQHELASLLASARQG